MDRSIERKLGGGRERYIYIYREGREGDREEIGRGGMEGEGERAEGGMEGEMRGGREREVEGEGDREREREVKSSSLPDT